MKTTLKEISEWKSVDKSKIDILYDYYYDIFDDKRKLCKKCPAVIRAVFTKVKKYYLDNEK